MKVKTRLPHLMAEKRMNNISELARETGLTRITLTKLYNDEITRIEFETIAKLCHYFNCDVKDLLYLDEEWFL